MSRMARQRSESGFYHILLRSAPDGFFRDAEDFEKFSELLRQNKKECGYFLYAFALLKEEIRLLIKANDIKLETIFKKLCIKYTYWYNCKYNRRGSVFFDRYKSEPVDYEDVEDVIRYIIRYPEKSGNKFDSYLYSSFTMNTYVDIYKKFDREFYENAPDKEYLSVRPVSARITDEEAVKRILSIVGASTVDDARQIDYSENKDYIKQMISVGIGYRQISRILGISYVFAKKAANGDKVIAKPPVKRSSRPVKKTMPKTEETIDFFEICSTMIIVYILFGGK